MRMRKWDGTVPEANGANHSIPAANNGISSSITMLQVNLLLQRCNRTLPLLLLLLLVTLRCTLIDRVLWMEDAMEECIEDREEDEEEGAADVGRDCSWSN